MEQTPAPEPAASARRVHPLRRWAVRLLKLGLLVFLGLLAVLYSLQTRMIFPGAATQGHPDAAVRPAPGVELVTLTTAAGDRIAATFAPALTNDGQPHPDAARRPTILFFYGNGMCLAYAEDIGETFRRLGANVMIPEYVGYGVSTGEPSEAGCYATADAAYEHLKSRKDVDPARIIASGWSLGGGVAVDLAVREKPAALAVFSTFTSLPAMVNRLMPWVPASLLLKHRFDSIDKIGRVACPILIGHGRVDSIVPCDMSQALAKATTAPTTHYIVEGADHNDFFMIGRTETCSRLSTLIEQVAR